MSWKKNIFLSLLIGLLLTGIGIGLVALGGWGPCGPASPVAAIGGYLCIEHISLWAAIIPGFEEGLAVLHIPDLVSLVLIPSLDFTVLAFLLCAVGSMFTNRHRSL